MYITVLCRPMSMTARHAFDYMLCVQLDREICIWAKMGDVRCMKSPQPECF
jgi:hypothetical protein